MKYRTRVKGETTTAAAATVAESAGHRTVSAVNQSAAINIGHRCGDRSAMRQKQQQHPMLTR
ncbi:hypothetical protein TYRP_020435 [Tyrophagus putrescentiae]|nr:hypothetical protein TYRP_020435 [Tyrophagus putrescentiae]